MAGRNTRTPAFTLIEVIITIGIVVIISSMLWYLRLHFREMSQLQVCTSNLKGIGVAFYTYCTGSSDAFPVVPHRLAIESGYAEVTYAPGAIGKDADRPSTIDDDQVSTTRNLWVLIQSGSISPGQFICPSTEDQKSEIEDPMTCWDFGTHTTDCTAGTRVAFSQVSYGYQVPYGLKGKPCMDRPQRMALAADKGPYSMALEAGEHHPGPPNLDATARADDWKPWNSRNHGGKGQTVLFADSHAAFLTTPNVGVDGDNVYTRWAKPVEEDSSETNRMNGMPPTGREAPLGETDSFIYP